MEHPPQTTVQIQACIDRLQSGDAAARNELLKAAGDRLQRLAHKMVKSFPRVRRWDETDDVMQNAILRLCRTLQDVTPKTAQDFYRLAALNIRRELLDLAKHHYGPQGDGAHHATIHDDPKKSGRLGPLDPSDTTHDPGSLASWSEFHEQVDALPDEEREVFDLLWYQGLTQAQAAEVLNTSERTVKRRWQAARLRLHEALNGELPE